MCKKDTRFSDMITLKLFLALIQLFLCNTICYVGIVGCLELHVIWIMTF